MWKVVQCAVQGRGHLKEDIPCQDKTYWFGNDDITVTALADGAGSAKLSHIGAEQITQYICNDLTDNFDYYYANEDGAKVKCELDNKIKTFIRNLAEKAECQERDLASTLLVVAVKDERYILMHIGDGVIGYSKKGEIKVASYPENGEFTNTTVFTTSNEALMTMKMMKGKIGSIDSFILMSDGTEASLYNKKERTLAGALSKIVMLLSILPTEKIKEQLEESFINVIRNATIDDCSISIMARCLHNNMNFLDFSHVEKAKIFHIKRTGKTSARRIKRYDEILSALKEPTTVKSLSHKIHLKEKYTLKRLSKLMELNLIEQNSNYYQSIIL